MREGGYVRHSGCLAGAVKESDEIPEAGFTRAQWRALGKKVARRCFEFKAGLEDAREERDRLVLEAIDRGFTYDDVAHWFMISRTRAAQIVWEQSARDT